MLKYFEDLVGKGLEWTVLAELMFYFSVNLTPQALPLAILLASLMTYGNMGEHLELTAIKSSGISLLRTIFPLFILILLIFCFALYFNDFIVPKANVNAYALLYDIRQKKPSFDLKEGQFYNGIPGYSIKVAEKEDVTGVLTDIIIYDHTKEDGNNNIIMARSGKMYSILNQKYIIIELFDGNLYSENSSSNAHVFNSNQYNSINPFMRNAFSEMKMVFSLASFDMNRTKRDLFSTNRMMKNSQRLISDIDSMKRYYWRIEKNVTDNLLIQNKYHSATRDAFLHNSPPPPVSKSNGIHTPDEKIFGTDSVKKIPHEENATSVYEKYKTEHTFRTVVLERALENARTSHSYINQSIDQKRRITEEIWIHEIERYKKISLAFSCICMFLIGAPLGSIIKKGGLGVPALISIAYFILFYICSLMSEKYARDGTIDTLLGSWIANIVLLPFGIFFLIRAKNDSRLLESDFYYVWIDTIKQKVLHNPIIIKYSKNYLFNKCEKKQIL